MNRIKMYWLSITVFFVIVAIFVFFRLEINSPSANEPEIVNQNYIVNDVEIYDLSYAYLTRGILSPNDHYKVDEIEYLIQRIDMKDFLSKKNSLYNLWLLMSLEKSINYKDKDQIVFIKDFILKLKNEQGYFTSYSGEVLENKANYLISTKMALDISNYYDIDLNLDNLPYWISDVSQYLSNNTNTYDFVSYGGYVSSLLEINTLYQKNESQSLLSSKQSSFFSKVLSKKYTEEHRISIPMLDNALRLNNLFEKDYFQIDLFKTKKYIESIQLEDGTFPIDGYDEYDSLSTLLVVNLFDSLKLELPNKNKLKIKTEKVIDSTMLSIKN